MINSKINNAVIPQDPSTPENRWDFARSLRNIQDKPLQTDFKYMGRLRVDWEKIYNDLKDQPWRTVAWDQWNWRVERYRNQIPFPQNESTDNIDLTTVHFRDTMGSEIANDTYEPFAQILDDLGLYMPSEDPNVDSRYRALVIARQLPGDMLWMHYDLRADDQWEQYLVFLNDWQPGQVSLWGTQAITNWKSGDCYWINTLITPHGAVNCGPGERWCANIKGRPRPNRTFQFLAE